MGSQDRKVEAASERRARKAEKDAKGGLDGLFNGKGGGAADWGSATPGYVVDLIVAMQSVGGAVTFGLSRDGGAYMLTFLLDGDRKTQWLAQTEDIDVWLEALVYEIRAFSQ